MKESELEAELEALVNRGAVYSPAGARFLELAGQDTSSFLHRLTTQDIKRLTTGQYCHTALLDRKGKLISFFGLVRTGPESFLLHAESPLYERAEGHLQQMKILDQVTFSEATNRLNVFFLFGPQIRDFQVTQGRGHSWEEGIYSSPARGFILPREEGEPFLQKLEGRGLKALHDEAFELLRIDSGLPRFGQDIDETTIILEGNLHFAVARNKGCYPGQEVVERIFTYGKGRTPRALCRFEYEKTPPLELPAALFNPQGEEIGRITSARWHPLKKKTLLLAMVERKYTESLPALVEREGRWVLSPR